VKPVDSVNSAVTVVAKIAPKEINAPAKIARTKVFEKLLLTFIIPASSACTAILSGINESIFYFILLY